MNSTSEYTGSSKRLPIVSTSDLGTDRRGTVGTGGGTYGDDVMVHKIKSASCALMLCWEYIVSLRVNCALKSVLAWHTHIKGQ
jgi:hypothetical protein